MTKFEYKTITIARKGVLKAKFNPDDELNKHGAEGWQVVSTYTSGAAGVGGQQELSYTLMRQVN